MTQRATQYMEVDGDKSLYPWSNSDSTRDAGGFGPAGSSAAAKENRGGLLPDANRGPNGPHVAAKKKHEFGQEWAGGGKKWANPVWRKQVGVDASGALPTPSLTYTTSPLTLLVPC